MVEEGACSRSGTCRRLAAWRVLADSCDFIGQGGEAKAGAEADDEGHEEGGEVKSWTGIDGGMLKMFFALASDGDEEGREASDEEIGVRKWEKAGKMTTNPGTMSGMQGKAIPQIADSIKANDVADGPFSLILNQVEKGVAAPMAVLYLLAGGE